MIKVASENRKILEFISILIRNIFRWSLKLPVVKDNGYNEFCSQYSLHYWKNEIILLKIFIARNYEIRFNWETDTRDTFLHR